MLGQLRQESRGVAAESTKSCDSKGSETDVGATPHPPSEYFSNLVFLARRRATSGDGGLDAMDKGRGNKRARKIEGLRGILQ
jgi:hypothetical protein